MDRVRWIDHRGRKVLFVDLSNVQDTEVEIEAAEEAERMIREQPPHTVLTMIDYTDMRFNSRGVEAQKKYSEAVKPYVLASAAVGIDLLKKVIVRSVARITGRNIRVFDDRESALDWLITQ